MKFYARECATLACNNKRGKEETHLNATPSAQPLLQGLQALLPQLGMRRMKGPQLHDALIPPALDMHLHRLGLRLCDGRLLCCLIVRWRLLAEGLVDGRRESTREIKH